ncbi:MAG: right-handed parallel beta-helix repeat-containing protein [Anditalea sp.]
MIEMNMFKRVIVLFFAVFLQCAIVFAQAESSNKGLLNVKNNKAIGDGIADDTKAIQETINKAAEGDTVFIPEGTYLVRAIGLKSGVHIKSEGLLTQQIDGEKEGFSISRQNSSAPLFRGKDISNVSLSFRAQTLNEAVYLSGSRDVVITKSTLMGDSTKIQSFAGILLYDCENISIEKTTISHYGSERTDPAIYQPGTAVRILSSNNISVIHCNILDNGENGVFIHESPDVEVSNNRLLNNGMSAIQVAFGSKSIEKNYKFINNLMEGNAADAIDINNRSPREFLDINCLIRDNISRRNGFVKGESTRDGSGIATLVNVSGVEILNNTAEKNNRPSLYIEDCGNIYATGNQSDNQVEVVERFQELNLSNNTFSIVSLLANVKGKKLMLDNNKLHSLSLPNGIHVDSLILRNNIIANANLNFNMTGNVEMVGNTVASNAKDGAILIVRVNSAHLEKNQIVSTQSQAITIRNLAENVCIIDNDIKSINTCIYDDGSKGLNVTGNKLVSLKGGRFRHTMVSRNPNQLFLSNNVHVSGRRESALRLEGQGTAQIIEEEIKWGYAEYGSVEVKETID